jgi:hypothetical protein
MYKLTGSRNHITARIIFLITACAFPFCPVYGKNCEFMFTTGVERDFINYEDESDSLIIRGGTSVRLGDNFYFKYTGLRNMDNGTLSCTWNLGLQDIGSFMNFTAGNYFLHFGSGLGKKSYTARDPFIKKISISKDEIITPAEGTGPEYSLFGASACIYKVFEDIRISILPFFSSQKRFISPEDYESGAIESSLFTLSSKIRKDGNSTEPVNILNYGGAVEIRALSLFQFQFYCFDTDLKGDSGEDIRWDRNKFNYGEGVGLIRNCGMFAEYSDENISFFIEPAISRIYCADVITDYAVAWGMGIRNPVMNFSFRGKNTGSEFHSEYSSGSRTPERIMESRFSLFPVKNLEAGFAIYSEKSLVPAYNKDYAEGSVQEAAFMAINAEIIHISLDVKRKEHYSTDRDDPLDRGDLAAGIIFTERIFLKLKGSIQRFNGENSGMTGCELKLMFMEYCSLSLGYAKIIINGAIPFYGSITPAPAHSSVECFNESAHGAAIKFRFQKEHDSFYTRVGMKKTGSETEVQAESAVVLVF